MAAAVYLGIDVGGTGIKAGLVDERGQLLHHAETPTRSSEGVSHVLDRVEQVARMVLNRSKEVPASCGIGSAGRIDHRSGVVLFASGILGWTGQPLAEEFSRRLKLPVTVDNDVNVAALAEGWLGAARGVGDYLMVTLGTGVGGAAVTGGKLWRGARFGAGEVGHMTLYPGGLPCSCGGTGCAEQYVSAKALTRRSNAALADGHPFRGIRDVLGAIDRGKDGRREAAKQGVDAFTSDLALVLVNLQQAFDPQVIIIGGGIVRLGYWWDRLQEALSREGRARTLTVRIKRAHFGPQAGVIGAARLAMLEAGKASKTSTRVLPGRLTAVERP